MNDQQPIMISFAPVPAKPRRARRAGVVVLATAVLVGLAGTAAFAWQRLSGGGTQPDEVLPASTVAFVRLDADPSAGQKIALLKLIRKFPEAAKSIGLTSPNQDVRKLLLEDAVGSCDLDYDKDVKPWLGYRLGVGLLDKSFEPVIAIQVTDEAGAKTGIPALLECSGESDPGVAFLDGYAIVTQKKADAATAVAAAQKSPLTDNPTYAADIEALGDEGVFSAWFDADAAKPALAEYLGGEVSDEFDTDFYTGTGAMTIRAASDAVELNIVSKNSRGPQGAKPVARLANLPTDTVAALALGGLGEGGATLYDNFVGGVAQSGGSADEVNDYLRTTFGLDPSKDLETLLGEGLTLAVGSTNLDTVSTMSDPSQVSALDVSLAMQSEPGKAADLARRLADLAETAGVSLVVEPTEDGAVLATNKRAAKGTGGLGEESRFQKVIPNADKALFGFYFDFTTVLDAVSAADPPKDVASTIDELRVLSAFGMSSSIADDDGYLYTNATLAFAE